MPWEVTIDVCPPYTHVPQQALLEAVTALRGQGFRICADGVGDGDVPLRLLTDMAPDLVKLDASLLARPAAVRAMRTLCDELGALSGGRGGGDGAAVRVARAAGAQLAQGELFAPPARLPAADVYVPPRPPGDVPAPRSGPSVREFVRPAALLPDTASAGQVRALLTGSPDVSGVLLVDTRRRAGAVGAPLPLPAVDVGTLRACPVRRPPGGQARRRAADGGRRRHGLGGAGRGGGRRPGPYVGRRGRGGRSTGGVWASYGSRTWCGRWPRPGWRRRPDSTR